MMNVQEFKAWFDGFTELMDGPPSAGAWKRIVARVASVKDTRPVDQHQFYHHYVRPVIPNYPPYYGTLTTHRGFDSRAAFMDLGRVEGGLKEET